MVLHYQLPFSYQSQVFLRPPLAILISLFWYYSLNLKHGFLRTSHSSVSTIIIKGLTSIPSLTSKVSTSESLLHHPVSFLALIATGYLINYIFYLSMFVSSQKCKHPKNRGLQSPALSTQHLIKYDG